MACLTHWPLGDLNGILKYVIFNHVLLNGIFRSSHDNAFWWMPQDLTDDKSTLVQVMAWGRQPTSRYLSQCWLSSLSPYGDARAQWVKHIYIFLKGKFLISSAADIVSGAYPMLSCPSELWKYNFDSLLLILFNRFLITKIGKKREFYRFLAIFSKDF